jgi:transcriptional regulator
MADDKVLERLAALTEIQIALDLHFRGAKQSTIARILNKSKTWVNDLLKGMPQKD